MSKAATALIKRAIAKYGTQGKLATACNVTQTAIWQAKESGHCSAELAMGIEHAMAGEITARQLRPDLPWPAPVSASNTPSADDTARHGGASSPGPNPGTAAALAPDGDAGRVGAPAAAEG